VWSDGNPDAFHHEVVLTSKVKYPSHIQVNILHTITDCINELSGDDLVRFLLIHYQPVSSPLPVCGWAWYHACLEMSQELDHDSNQ
jgi:hypothetical protein